MNNYTILLVLLIRNFVESISCLDEKNQKVDWIIGYKLPDSYNYAYFSSIQSQWVKSDMNVLYNGTLKNIMNSGFGSNKNSSKMFSMYNDEKSSEKYSTKYGHMKGMISFDKKSHSGFWLIHSIPKLSDNPFYYEYPKSGYIYGQHFFCMSLEYKYLVNLFKYSRPYIQSSWLSQEIESDYPDMADLNANKLFKMENDHDIANIKTKDLEIFAFSKSKAFNNDLYDGLVAKSLNVSLEVETWQHGHGVLPPGCHNNYDVVSVTQISFEPYKIPVSFSTEHDHAKWAVSFNQSAGQKFQNVVCLGDINRMESQFIRGGGTACIINRDIWQNFEKLVKDANYCSNQSSN